MTNIWNKVKLVVVKVYSVAPFGVGVVAGYVLKSELKWAVDAVAALVKGLLKI